MLAVLITTFQRSFVFVETLMQLDIKMSHLSPTVSDFFNKSMELHVQSNVHQYDLLQL